MKTPTKKLSHSEEQAQSQMESIREMVAALGAGDDEKRERAEQAIHEDPLSVEVRSGWHKPGAALTLAKEYILLLCTGGPACRLIGELEDGEPISARLEHQNWRTPWTPCLLSRRDEDVLLRYARCFYFG